MKYKLSRRTLDKENTWSIQVPVLLGTVTCLLLIVQVILSNRLANTGLELNKVNQEIAELVNKNTQIHEQTASASSLLTIQTKARTLGFNKSSDPVFLSREIPVALK